MENSKEAPKLDNSTKETPKLDNSTKETPTPITPRGEGSTTPPIENKQEQEKEKKVKKIDQSNALIKHLSEAIKNPKYCDTIFIVGDKKSELYSNSLLLRQTKVLEKLLQPKEEKQPEKKKPEHAKVEPVDHLFFKPIIVIDSEPQIFKLFLQYIHTGSITITPEATLPLLHLARKYDIESLQRDCTEFANSLISVENALEFLQSSINFHENLLAQKCFEIIDSNTSDALKNPFIASLTSETLVQILWRDTLTIDEFDLFEKLLFWSSKQTDDVKKKEFPKLLHHIRLAIIPHADILKKKLSQPMSLLQKHF